MRFNNIFKKLQYLYINLECRQLIVLCVKVDVCGCQLKIPIFKTPSIAGRSIWLLERFLSDGQLPTA